MLIDSVTALYLVQPVFGDQAVIIRKQEKILQHFY
jgi:hypothetical protein